jgi:rubrerythrin
MVHEEIESMVDVEDALAIIRRAIQNEIAGQRFYNDAAYHCIDPWAKETFAQLASEEEVHTRVLLLAHEALRTTGRWIDLEAARDSDVHVDITRINFGESVERQELFPPQWSIGEAIDRRSDDLAALAFGMAMEETAIDLYSEAAKACDSLEAKRTYNYLIEDETRHHEQLKAQWEELAGRAFRKS